MIAYLLPALCLDVCGAPIVMDGSGSSELTNTSISRRKLKLLHEGTASYAAPKPEGIMEESKGRDNNPPLTLCASYCATFNR
jgi:hypothetical protein